LVNLNKNMKRKLPKVHKHNLAILPEGVGGSNPKEYCNCDNCIVLRKRRDLIYNKWYHKLKRWCNNFN